MRALRLNLTIKFKIEVQLFVKIMIVTEATLLLHCDNLIKKINWYMLLMTLIIF